MVTSGTFDPLSNQDDRLILQQMLMKCADVSNPTKEWPIYQEWINRILEEFYNQGDLERKLGLPISPFMNRDSIGGPSAQKGFIEFIVYPLFEALEFWTPLRDIKVTLDSSRDRFCVDHTATKDSAEFANKKKSLRPLKIDFNSDQSGSGSMIRSASDYSPPLSARRASVAMMNGPRRASVVNIIRNFTHTRAHSTTAVSNSRPTSNTSLNVGSGTELEQVEESKKQI